MKNFLLQSRFFLLAGIMLFSIGCYTQFGTIKRTSQKEYEPPQEQQVYEPEYQDNVDTTYVQENQAPVYQYNFYGADPFYYDFYSAPFYSGFSFGLGFYDPWFYDPWDFDPFYASFRFGSFYQPYSYFGWRSRPWAYYSGYYNGYWNGYYGYSSPYYGTYDPYWGAVNPGYSINIPQKRRDFGQRRGIDPAPDRTSHIPYMATTTSGAKNISRVERIRKTKPSTINRTSTLTGTSRERTRRNDQTRNRILSTKPVRKVSSQGRLSRTPTRIRSKRTTAAPSGRSKITTRRRTAKSVPNVRSKPSRTRKSSTPSNVRRTRTTKSYSPSSSRTRSRSTTVRRSGSSYKPRTSRSSGSAVRSTRSTTSRSSSRGSSSSRTKKKK